MPEEAARSNGSRGIAARWLDLVFSAKNDTKSAGISALGVIAGKKLNDLPEARSPLVIIKVSPRHRLFPAIATGFIPTAESG